MRKLVFIAIPLLLAATVLFTTFAPAPAQSSVIDFEDPPLGRLDRQVINPYVDAPSQVSFSALDAKGGVVGIVKNSATSACVEPSDSNQKLGTAPVDSDSIGLSGFAIRADFPQELAPPVRVGVTFQTGVKVPIRIRLFDATGGEVGSTSDVASPENGTCGLPGDPRARKTIFAASDKPVAYAVMDLEESTGGRVFVLDDFQYTFNENPNEIGDIAYVLGKDTASASAFEALLKNEGYSVDLIQLGNVLSTDFTPYQMVVIGNDTGKLGNWGDAAGQVKQIVAAQRPIVGIGEGGYAFFGQVWLQIGHGNGWHREDKAVVGNAGLLYYQTPYDLSGLVKSLELYTDEVGEVGIHLPEPIVDVIPLGREPNNKTHYPLIAQKVDASRVRGQICHQLWGFEGNPRQMTKAGQQLFANAVNFGLSSCPDERPADPTPTAIPSATPTRTPRPTWTALPTLTPTPGPTATPFPLVQAIPYNPITEFVARPVLVKPDLSIHGIELTQGVQCFDTSNGLSGCSDNSLPLVAKKNSTARIYLKYADGNFTSYNHVPVRLYIRANNVWYTANVSGKAVQTLDQSKTDSADVYFNVNFTNDIAVDFYAVVDPDGTISETNESNNRFPATGFITRTFQKGITLDIVGQRLDYQPSGYSGDRYSGGWAVNGGAADYLEQLLPIRTNGIDYSVKSGYMDWNKALGGSGDNQHDLIKTLNGRWIMENAFSWLFGTGAFTGAEHVYGWAPNDGYSGGHADMPVYPHAGGLGIVGIGTDDPGTNTDDPGRGALIFAHELIHDYDVKHTNTGSDDCGSNDSSSTFPYNTSSIQEFGFNPITGKIYDPADTHDVMSYCPAGGSKEGWISPFTWNYMFNRLDAAAVNAAEQRAAPKVMRTNAMTQSLVVNLTIFNPDAPAYDPETPGLLGNLHRIDGGIQYDPPGGEYEVQLRNGDEVLVSQNFAASFKSEYDGHVGHNHGVASDGDDPPFPATPTLKSDVSFIMPWAENVDNVALVLNGELLDTRNVSSSAPVVTITSPGEAVEWPADSIQQLTWEAGDPDTRNGMTDDLHYSVFYSTDSGESWQLLATELVSPTYEVDTASMAGTNDARFRVVATDGVNIGFDETDEAVSILNKAPDVAIIAPYEGQVVGPGELAVLYGSGSDLEDGNLADEALEWSSDKEGSLGIGSSLPINTLSSGEHVITLTGRDSFGIVNSSSVKIFVGERIFLPNIQKQ